MEIRVRNVQAAYATGLSMLREFGAWEETRNGRALVLPEPMVTIYERPLERVLLDPIRDANPFFHLMEAVWMLAGRNDVASLLPFNRALAQYSDDGETYHGAYGHRWRRKFVDWGNGDPEFMKEIDQVRRAVELLRANPADRRVVIQMWDTESDLGRPGKDFPCNTQLFFRTRLTPLDRAQPEGERNPAVYTLDMTILNRSNDAIWGAYGANAVHFSVLQEFIAAAAGMSMGRMIQFSNNFHAYEAVLEKVGVPRLHFGNTQYEEHGNYILNYDKSRTGWEPLRPTPLFRVDATTDLDEVLRAIDMVWEDAGAGDVLAEPLLHRLPYLGQFTEDGLTTIETMRDAYLLRGERMSDVIEIVARLNNDWGRAGSEWLIRRHKK